MYDTSLYRMDPNGGHEAALGAGAILYRLSSIHFSNLDTGRLDGQGPVLRSYNGRFNSRHQVTSYCANNALVCISEVLYHMYRDVLDKMRDGKDYSDVTAATHAEKCLMIFRIKDEIPDMVWLDSNGTRVDLNSKVSGTTTVFPDNRYKHFDSLNDQVRGMDKRGILYPSARHSRDMCIALFGNNTNLVDDSLLVQLNMSLTLIPEHQSFDASVEGCDPFQTKLHPTMGHYKITSEQAFEEPRTTGLLNPANLPLTGFIDFVRRQYSSYPDDAVMSA